VSDAASPVFDGKQFKAWLSDLAGLETHTARRYELEVALDPANGLLEVEGTVSLAPPAPPGPPGPPGLLAQEARFLLSPGLEIAAPESGDRPAALRRVPLAPGQTELRLAYRGRLPGPWITPASSELTLHNLWFPLFSVRPLPFTFRVLVRVPQDSVTAAGGRLVPLPPHLRPRVHDHAAPRAYLWESAGSTTDIAICSGPYLVHQRQLGPLTLEVFTLGEDFELGQPCLDWMERILACLTTWSSPLEVPDLASEAAAGAPARLGLIITPESIVGGYSRPGHIVLPRPMAAGVLDPAEEQSVALWLAHEMGRQWFGGLAGYLEEGPS